MGLNNKEQESPVAEILPAVQEILEECDSNGIDAIWRRLRKAKMIIVKR
jgi:hypothetical protein